MVHSKNSAIIKYEKPYSPFKKVSSALALEPEPNAKVRSKTQVNAIEFATSSTQEPYYKHEPEPKTKATPKTKVGATAPSSSAPVDKHDPRGKSGRPANIQHAPTEAKTKY